MGWGGRYGWGFWPRVEQTWLQWPTALNQFNHQPRSSLCGRKKWEVFLSRRPLAYFVELPPQLFGTFFPILFRFLHLHLAISAHGHGIDIGHLSHFWSFCMVDGRQYVANPTAQSRIPRIRRAQQDGIYRCNEKRQR